MSNDYYGLLLSKRFDIYLNQDHTVWSVLASQVNGAGYWIKTLIDCQVIDEKVMKIDSVCWFNIDLRSSYDNASYFAIIQGDYIYDRPKLIEVYKLKDSEGKDVVLDSYYASILIEIPFKLTIN